MGNYVLLTKLSGESVIEPKRLIDLERQVKERIKKECEDVRWVSNHVILGPYDYLDVFEAPDALTASKVATIVRSFGHATTETWNAIPWEEFKSTLVH
jgi:uncharacterized protein with GYD domain